MFTNPSPFAMFSGNNLFRENIEKDESEDYFSSQLTQSTSLNTLSVQNSLINSKLSGSCLSQSYNLEKSRNKNLEESQNVIININKGEQNINGKKQINIYIKTKIFEDNPDINIICINNNNNNKEETNSNNKNDRNNINNNEMENNRINNYYRRENPNDLNYLNIMNKLRI